MDGSVELKTVPEVQSGSRTKGEKTRERLLNLAQESIIRKGFGATSIEELVEAAGITKSGFFYHFRDKTDLARQLVERYIERNKTLLTDMAGRSRELSDDPLHAFLIFLKLYAEAMDDKVDEHPGCIVATITFQDLIWDGHTRHITMESVRQWRVFFLTWLEEIAAAYPLRANLELSVMADQLLALTYGGMTLAKALQDSRAIGKQALMFRETVRLCFRGT